MNGVWTSLIVSAVIFAGAIAGMWLHRLLPSEHLSKDTQDVVRLGTGMLSVLASLVLGLLIATAKSAYDTTDREVRAYSAELILLSETLRDYGKEAADAREKLRLFAAQVLDDTWPRNDAHPPVHENHKTGDMLERVREAIRALQPGDAGAKWLQDQALQNSMALMRQRWLLIAQAGPSVRPVVLVILVGWITLIFTSFGLNAPRNGTVVAAFLVCSLSIGGSVFLILQMDNPYGGAMKMSPLPMETALDHLSN